MTTPQRDESGEDSRLSMSSITAAPIGSNGPAAKSSARIRESILSKRRGGDQSCALCDGDGDVVNPLNADPAVKVTDWHPPVGCPRCGQTGKDPNP